MLDDNYSRRQILGAATGVSALGLSVGAATRAYLVDGEVFPGNRLQAGGFTLELAGEGATGTDHVSGFPGDDDFAERETIAVEFPDLEPGDEGVFTAAYRLCENPGRVWVRSRLVGSGDTDLEEYLHVGLSTRPDCGDAKQTQFEGTLGEFNNAYSEGALLGCRYAGKVEYEGGQLTPEDGERTNTDPYRFEFTTDDGETLVIELTNLVWKEDDEIVGFDYEVLEGPGVCEVVVAGGADPRSGSPGPKQKHYDYRCTRDDRNLATPEKDESTRYGLSHVEFYVCGGCRDCEPGCLDLEWQFDSNPPEELLNDSLGVELEFRAVQCRHQTEPTNPWS